MAPDATPIRALLVDDEPLARERLHELLEAAPTVTVVGAAEDGLEAVEAIRERAPDLVFLDVQMPGKNGIDVIEEIGTGAMPVTVFVTAYDQYAIQAFDLAAVDYLLKPFDDERFEQALRRAREQIANQADEAVSERLLHLLQERDPSLLNEERSKEKQSHDEPYLQRIAVQGRGKARIVPVDDLTHITADGSYAELHTGEDTYVIRERMKTLAARLDPDTFVRVHRSAIVRLDEIEMILRGGGGNYAVRLKGGTRVSVSRSRVDELQDRLGVDVLQRNDADNP
ncbi:LytR/AlgR family response regulator transcription factor [Salinibacter altiplanensis]|uniref:LytR/AlgR family response regulator transcription factor n=1 Tax=Salinibacter altiplanensis TaxID=1803181 RepID=UPI000C9FD99C|nr:LytTR family DNA-binding domain-containing protein [Salinibacter altiplanensis]